MPILFFLPWAFTAEPISIRGIRLLPYVRENAPGAQSAFPQRVLDAILGNYADRSNVPGGNMGMPVRRATIVQWDGDSTASEPDEAQLDERMHLAVYLAFTALSERPYGSAIRYCNSTGYALVAQRFIESDPSALMYVSRRRDGQQQNMVSGSRGRPLFLRPEQVDSRLRVELDLPLLHALLTVPRGELRTRLFDAISIFNQANTDARDVPQSAELVMVRCAIDTLLQSGYKVDEFRSALMAHFTESRAVSSFSEGVFDQRVWMTRWPRSNSPLDAWAQDFAHARNDSAHGTDPSGRYGPGIWSVPNHLLFTCWLFPLMVKKILANAGYYQLSEFELDCRTHFERYFAHDVVSAHPNGSSYWNFVDDELRLIDLGRVVFAHSP